jgi:hypothetical protein
VQLPIAEVSRMQGEPAPVLLLLVLPLAVLDALLLVLPLAVLDTLLLVLPLALLALAFALPLPLPFEALEPPDPPAAALSDPDPHATSTNVTPTSRNERGSIAAHSNGGRRPRQRESSGVRAHRARY